MDLDREALMPTFLEEAREGLEAIEQQLLRLEREQGAARDPS